MIVAMALCPGMFSTGREVQEFRKLQQLTREFLGTNAEICRLRPVEGEAEEKLKKNARSAAARDHARSRAVLAGDVRDRRNTGRIDLEATEMAMRSALHWPGAAALSQPLQFPAPSRAGRTLRLPGAL